MLTNAELQEKYGKDIVFLFKGDEPYTESLGNPLGVLIERDDKVLCFECETWHERLYPHLKKEHSLTTEQYKEKWGFNKSAPLCSSRISKTLSEKSLAWDKKHPSAVRKRTANLKLGYKSRRRKDYKASPKRMQASNARASCPEQIKQRYFLLQAKYGKDVGLNTIRITDSYVEGYAIKHYGSWNNFKKYLGESTQEGGPAYTKEKADLIYDLRLYVEKYNKLPWDPYTKRAQNGFPHSITPYETKWGTMSNAYLVCGLNGQYFINANQKAQKYWYCDPEWASLAQSSEDRLNSRAIKMPSTEDKEFIEQAIENVKLKNKVDEKYRLVNSNREGLLLHPA